MPWPRFATILSATILEADPALAAERAERARSTQDVFSFDSRGRVEEPSWRRRRQVMPSGFWRR